MKIGILGGRFDPPHLGHLAAAKKALEMAGLEEVWFVPYNKRNLNKIYDLRFKNYDENSVNFGNNKQRLEMTKLAIRGQKKLKVLDVEIKRGGVSYTIDTIRELKEKYSHDEFFVIVGQDLVEELPKWKEYENLKKMVEFLVIPRGGYKSDAVSNLSSTIIRERVGGGLSIKGMVAEKVENYIYKHKLYK